MRDELMSPILKFQLKQVCGNTRLPFRHPRDFIFDRSMIWVPISGVTGLLLRASASAATTRIQPDLSTTIIVHRSTTENTASWLRSSRGYTGKSVKVTKKSQVQQAKKTKSKFDAKAEPAASATVDEFEDENIRVWALAEDEKNESLDVGPNGHPVFTSNPSLSQLSRKDTCTYMKFRMGDLRAVLPEGLPLGMVKEFEESKRNALLIRQSFLDLGDNFRRIVDPPLQTSGGKGNMGNLLLIIVPAICNDDGSPFGDHKTCSSTGLYYASFSMAKFGAAMALVESDIGGNITFPALREFVKLGRPVWGTCAGLIFLANKATGQKTGGQELIRGLNCTINRNFFGSQEDTTTVEKVIVAVKQGNLLGTAFHTELTADTRCYFLKMVGEVAEGEASNGICAVGEELSFYQHPKTDLPIFQY